MMAIIMDITLTPDEKFVRVPAENEKPEPASSGFYAMNRTLVPPIIAHDPIYANGNLVCAEAVVNYGEGFIKLKREAEQLLVTDPNAFLLLTFIALRAKRKKTKFDTDKLEVGQASIKGCKDVGMSRQTYRNTLKRLTNVYFLISAIKTTNKETIVSISNCDVYDVNLDGQEPPKEPSKNHQRTTSTILQEECKNERKVNTKNETDLASLDVAVAPVVDLVNSPINVSDKKTFSDEIKAIAEGMIGAMRAIKPDYSSPKNLTPWNTHIDFMVRLDVRTPETILDVFSWALADDFWRDKMFTKNPPKYLRSKFDQFEIKMKTKPSQAKRDRKFAASSDDAKALKIMEEMSKRAL